jgi:ubiquinone/menaquinone biosynthesis C-methylase UbiE
MLRQAFDNYAPAYDVHFTNTFIGRLQRKRVYTYLKPLLTKQSRVLELSCGTGEDAIYMAACVHSVYATDQSEGMIVTAKQKSVSSNVRFNVCTIENISSAGRENSFDLIFSNFGGMNCVSLPDIKKCSHDLYQLCKPGARLVLVIMGKKCLWEKIYFLCKHRKDKAYRRLSGKGIPAQIGEESFLTYYYSPYEIKESFKEYFQVQYHRPVGFFIPPSYLEKFFKNKAWLLKIIYIMEKICGKLSILSNYADHYVIVLKKI